MTTPLAAVRMGIRLTTPFQRGADTLTVRLSPGAGTTTAMVQPYDFAEHHARFGRPPEPAYVLATTSDLGAETAVSVMYVRPGRPPGATTVIFPAGTPAGVSHALDIPVSEQLRVTALTMTPPPPGGRADRAWRLTALLGTTARVLWVLGGERDLLRGQLARTLAQRRLATATGPSLDLIGADLDVPRFPPLPYGFDDGTVALYHLDETAGAVQDVTSRYPGRTGHPGSFQGSARPGVAGRYGGAVGFDAPDAAVVVPTDPRFDVAANGSATWECFVRPEADSGDGQVLSRHSGGAGWLLSVGEFGRGVARNARLTVTDGSTPLTLFADMSLPADAFTHLAGVLDRTGQTLRLYVDGILRASAPLGQLGAVGNTAPLRIGPAGSAFRGVIDEVRVSAVARTGFAPTLGEADEHYRARLRVFRSWALPTPANLAAMLNKLVGAIGGLPDPLVIEDANATLVRGIRLVRVRPVELRQGEHIDAAGRRQVTEADAVGTAAREERFHPSFLSRYDNAAVDFTAAEPPADPHLIQVGLSAIVDRLVALTAEEPGRLRIGAAFDPHETDLRATGRAVLLGHSAIAPGRLAALAHRAGFDFVHVRDDDRPDGAQVYAAMAPGDYFAVDANPAGAGPTDLDVGSAVELSLRPVPSVGAVVRWRIVPGGPGRGTLTGSAPTLTATAPGELVVQADVTLGGHTVSASRTLRVGVPELPDGATITADGTLGAPVTAVSDPHEFFDQRFLLRHDDTRVTYGGGENSRLMQPAVARSLNALLDELVRRSVTGKLTVVSAFQPGGDEFGSHGRLLVLNHPNVSPAVLAAAAHAVGFGHVTHAGPDVVVRQAPGDLAVVLRSSGVDNGETIELDEGATVALSVQPLLANEVRLGWSSGTFDTAGVTLGNATQPTTTVRGDAAGQAWVQAAYLLGDLPAPHTFLVRLRSELDSPDTVISKDQYDLILNILNAFHPIGIEVDTRIIREHTVEVRDDLTARNPAFTFPNFRVRRVLPPLRKGNSRG